VRVAVVLVAVACASSPPREDDRPWESPCAGVDTLEVEVTTDHAVAPDTARDDSGEIEVVSCCRGRLIVDGELRLQFDDYRPAKLDMPIGKHRISVDIEGHRLWETYVAIAAGKRVLVKPLR
jgi:hypothetical protein